LLATSHLIAQGHTRLAFVTASGMTMSRREKINGFLAAARKAGLSGSAEVVEGTPLSEYGDSIMSEVGRITATELAARKPPRRPTGIVAVNDVMAWGLMAGFREAGLTVPQDMSVVGMDDVFLSALMNPPLTTVHLPVREMAQTIVERLMARLADPHVPTKELIFTPTLVERQSVLDRRRGKKAAGRALT
jgi:DNA-binding LacI/PurR family transcriptional regulator